MRGQNTDIGTKEAALIGLGILVVIGLLTVLLGGGPGTGPGPTINVSEETDGQATKIPYGSRIEVGPFLENIELVGAYAGHPFLNIYPNNATVRPEMRITQDIQPGDGIADVWIVGEMVNVTTDPAFRAEVYVDDDFRQEVPSANIAWGKNFSAGSAQQFDIRRFDYEEYRGGIYRDVVTDTDVDRFQRYGPDSEEGANVAVGNFSASTIGSQTAVTGQGITLVVAR